MLCPGLLAALMLLAAPAGAQKKWTEKEILDRFKYEPSVQQVQQKAIRYYQVHPDRIRSLRLTARLKALMPSISGTFSNGIYSVNRNMTDALYRTLGAKEEEGVTGDNMGFSVSASWNLDRLVFNAEVLDVQSLIGILDGVVREVTTIYYIRRRLQIDMILRPATDLASSISQRIRVEELTGLLDAMTGGYMTKSVIEAKKTARKAANFQHGGKLRRAQDLKPREVKPGLQDKAAQQVKPAVPDKAATEPGPTAPAPAPVKERKTAEQGTDLAMRKPAAM